jgi:hypothetical protein
MEYEVISYDVWGNARDGFDVNQSFRTGVVVTVEDTDTDATINRKLGRAGITGARGVTWDGTPGMALYGEYKRNGRPAAELRAVTD